MFNISVGVVICGARGEVEGQAREVERQLSGVGNAGLFKEGVGSLPVLKSHIPGNRPLRLRNLPILSGNLAHMLPLFLENATSQSGEGLKLASRNNELSFFDLFSRENLNFNAFICGASGSGKSFLMNSCIADLKARKPSARVFIFDVGGSYQKLIGANRGTSLALTVGLAKSLIATHFRKNPISPENDYQAVLEVFCGKGAHFTHSHRVALKELLQSMQGEPLLVGELLKRALGKKQGCFSDLSHWLNAFRELDDLPTIESSVLNSHFCAFDFKDLESDPILQKATILILTNQIWADLSVGSVSETIVVFDEVWRFFTECRGFLEEMYRTFRKYRAGIVSITQNLNDYGDDSFAKMVFTNSYSKIFLQGGASGEYLTRNFDMAESDVLRATSAQSRKPYYSELFLKTPSISQVFRLVPTPELYQIANSESRP